MSSNESDESTSGSEYRGAEIRSNAVADPLSLRSDPTGLSRAGLAGQVGTQKQRHLWDALNYPTNNRLDDWDYHWATYQRQEIAGGLVDKHVEDTWQEAPTVHDHGDTDTDEDAETDFETDVAAFLDNEDPLDLRQAPLAWFKAADLTATVGEFAVLVFGFKDGKDASEPLEEEALAGSDTATGTSGTGLDGLAFIDAFHEDQVQPEESTDLSDTEEYGTISKYKVTPRNGDPQTVHASRVVHPAEGALTSPHAGRRFLSRGINRFIDADKILGASAEGYWRGGYTGYLLKPPEVVTEDGTTRRADGFSDGGSALVEQMREFENDFRRNMTTNGEVEPLQSDVASPEPHMNEVYGALSAGYDVPQSVFKGNETGERATTEDDKQWASTIGGRRNHYAEGQIFRPTIDLLVYAGVVSAPGGDGYDAEWPALSEKSEQEEADIRKTNAQALEIASGGQPDTLANTAERREEIMGWSPEPGSETDYETPEGPEGMQAQLDRMALLGNGGAGGASETTDAGVDTPEGLEVDVVSGSDRTNASEGDGGVGDTGE